MRTTRTFIAIEIGPPACDVLHRLLEKLRRTNESVRWTGAEHLHVTLKFLGDIDNRELPGICSALEEACRQVEPFMVQVRGLGTFPRGKPPRVIWAGIEDGDERPMLNMHEKLDSTLGMLGVPREGRAFSPHLTLGRVIRRSSTSQLATQLQSEGESLSTQFEVDEVKLLASLKERGGIRYEPVSTVEL